MKDLIKYIVSSIVDQPDKVKIKAEENQTGLKNYILAVAPEDMGKVIGKRGRIIRALRDLVRVRSIITNEKALLILKED